ncbi:hypothetical protein ASPCAL09130 [Aspergillus calidoustus]|uniref:Uncharacterized protein n=1 Tax=Aspergillus calidoustus TaxID=454130 RepID=A0A0U5CRG7_ASPCI|nr:hypothetical protein ASPCAL09130 [Aspergillus calidoustus]
MPRGHKYQRSSSGAQSHNSNRKRNYPPRNHSASINAQQDMGPFERRASYPPPFWGWQHRPGRWFANHNGPTQRPFHSPPPPPPPPHLVPHELGGQEPYYPVVPFVADRGFNGQFRRGYPDYHNRLFLDEYRFPGPHQTYQPPHVAIDAQVGQAEQAFGAENIAELEDKPAGKKFLLRGDAPEFVPRPKERKEKKEKEPCWLVVSSQ